jgi:hypothetical protein
MAASWHSSCACWRASINAQGASDDLRSCRVIHPLFSPALQCGPANANSLSVEASDITTPTHAASGRNMRGGCMARNRSRVLTDHEEIRRWAEERNASPACVRRTGGDGDIGMIRLDFPGYSGEQSLDHVDWDDWFQKFDESNLALLVQDQLASGGQSNFNKLVGRETAERRSEGDNRASRHGARRGQAASRSRSASGRRSGAAASSGTRSRSSRKANRASAKRSSSQRSNSQRVKQSSGRGESTARAKRATSSRTKSSGTSSRGREPGRAVSRSKSKRGSQSAPGDITRRSRTVAGRNRGPASAGGRQAATSNTGRRSAKRNPEKVVKSAQRIRESASNIIRMERGQGRGPSSVTKRASAKSASGTARQSRSGTNARNRRRAA